MTPRRSPIANMDEHADDDPLHTMTVEHVTRPDGRYLLYFTWPPSEGDPGTPPEASGASGAEPDDV